MLENKTWQRIKRANPMLADAICAQHGVVLPEQTRQIISIDRQMLLLVRCNNGRFLAPAQDVLHFVNIINEHSAVACAIERSELPKNGDWVRDISLPE